MRYVLLACALAAGPREEALRLERQRNLERMLRVSPREEAWHHQFYRDGPPLRGERPIQKEFK